MVLLIPLGCALGAFGPGERAEPIPIPTDDDTGPIETDPIDVPSAEPPVLCVNELMSDNTNAVASENGTATDWVELHNPTSGRIELAGWTLGDDDRTPLDGLALAASSYLVLWADGREDVVGHLREDLGASGGQLRLTSPEGGEAVLTYGAIEADWSVARTTPCGPDWTWLWRGTPGYDNGGALTTERVRADDPWSWLDTGVAPEGDWTVAGFDDTAWAVGPAPLGYGEEGLASTVSYGPDPNNKYVTTWLRRRLEASDDAVAAELTLQVDDGAIAYLNGTEVARINLPAVTVEPSTLASATIPSEASWWRFVLDPELLLDGENVLAVEVHQASLSSSDLTWSATLTTEEPP